MTDDFVVNDKRLFTKDGQVSNEAKEQDEKNVPLSEPEKEQQSASGAASQVGHLPPANLASLLVGLATSAFMHLGEVAEQNGTQGQVDLPAAKHSIDLLSVLQSKTKGNLEAEEEALLNTLLYDLRLQYVQAASPQNK